MIFNQGASMGRIAVAARLLLIFCWSASLSSAQSKALKYDAQHLPRFEDFPASRAWNKTRKPVRMDTRGARMFRTNLRNAAKEAPDFAGHYKVAVWGCGSNCLNGNLIDLETGEVFDLPDADRPEWREYIFCGYSYDEKVYEVRVNSRLLITRCGFNPSRETGKNFPDVQYFVWDGQRFRSILNLLAKKARP